MDELIKELRAIRQLMEDNLHPKELISREEVSKMLDISLREVDRMTKDKELPSLKIGSRRLYPRKRVLEAVGAMVQ